MFPHHWYEFLCGLVGIGCITLSTLLFHTLILPYWRPRPKFKLKELHLELQEKNFFVDRLSLHHRQQLRKQQDFQEKLLESRRFLERLNRQALPSREKHHVQTALRSLVLLEQKLFVLPSR